MRIFKMVFVLVGLLFAAAQLAPQQAKAATCTYEDLGPEIDSLARALLYDPNLIYEYIYYNIDYTPTFGSKKGALGTLLAKSGNNMDQNVLFVALLRRSCITANYRYGTLNFPAETIANLLGVQNDMRILSQALGTAGIPTCLYQTSGGPCLTNGTGPAAMVGINMVWTEFTIGSTTYRLDPSLKSFTQYNPIDMASAMWYGQADFLGMALYGSSAGTGLPAGVTSIKGLNKAGITAKLNDYAAHLADYIRTNYPSSSAKQLFGGREINNTNYGWNLPAVGTVYTDLPTSLDTAYTITVSNNADGSNPTMTVTAYGRQIQGKRLTLVYDSSNKPTIAFEGTTLLTGPAATVTNQTVSLKVQNPYTAPWGTHTVRPTVRVGGKYAIVLSAGEGGRDELTRHQRAVSKLVQAHASVTDEPMVGEALAAIGSHYLAQSSRASQMIGNLGGTGIVRHEAMGIAGAAQSVYVDFPALMDGAYPKNTSVTDNALIGQYFALSQYDSSLESTTVSQLQNGEAVSTVRMFDYHNSDGTAFIHATPTNWSTVKPKLTGWSAADLADMTTWMTSGSSHVLFVPQAGNRTVGTWKGGGYYRIDRTGSIAANNLASTFGSIISGGYSGGWLTNFVNYYTAASADIFTLGQDVLNYASQALSNINSISAAALSFGNDYLNMAYDTIKSIDPIDMYSGAYTYEHEDISVGSGEFPFKLTLKSSYDSSRAAIKTALGYGWRHNFMMTANFDSDSYIAFGDYNPLAAVQTAVSAYVASDVMATSAPTLSNTVAASLVESWMMDQLVKNTVTVQLDSGTKKFVKIPAAGGGVTYVPPPNDASILVVNGNGTVTLTDKNQNVLNFNANGNITTWKDANNNTVSFIYTDSSVTQKLASVQNSVGRALYFSYVQEDVFVSLGPNYTNSTFIKYWVPGNLALYADPQVNVTAFAYQSGTPGLLTQLFYPTAPSTAFMTNTYDEFGHVKTQADALGNVWTYGFAEGSRAVEVNPEGGAHILYYDRNGNQTIDINALTERTFMKYDGIGRRVLMTYPLGDSVALTYDAKHNILTQTTNPIPGTNDPVNGQPATPIVQTFTYDPTFNKVLTAKDGLGNVTTASYDTRGNVLAITQPAVSKPGVSGTASPVSVFTYNSRGQPLTAKDAEGRVTAFSYDATNANLLTATQDSGSGRLNLTTSYGYNTVGDVTTVTDAKGFKVTYDYDTNRHPTVVTPDAPFNGYVTKYWYDALGRQIKVDQVTGQSSPAWRSTVTAYDVRGKVASVTAPDGVVKTNAYDTVQRLSTETYSSGRQVLYNYDLASQPIKVTDQVSGTLDASITVNRGAVVRQQMTYYPGGLPATLKDAKDNVTTYYYDGFKRRYQVVYPDHTGAASDYDLHGFDANGNELIFERRDHTQIWSTYDALNRRLTKAPSNQPTITYGYDYTGKLLTAQANGESAPTQISYDTAGRKVGEYSWLFGWTTAALDANGNRTSLTYPSSVGYVAAYDYDALNRLKGIYEGSIASGLRIVGYDYDPLSQRTASSFGPAAGPVASNSLTYTTAGQLASLAQAWNGASLSLGYAYNLDHQRKSLNASDNTFLPSGLGTASTAYVANNLNQYTALTGTDAATPVYDKRGNLTSDGTWTYGYDTENRLISASRAGVSATYSYDALGRRLFKTVNGTRTAYASYGDQELAEYVGTVSTVNFSRMFAYGPGLDEPVLSVAPGGARTYMFQDALGSVIALANASGQVTEKYAYTAYGLNTVTGTATAAYRFAGRRYDEETGLYFNRARAYSPTLGRFLQTDPIGTDGGINLYAYTGNNPINATDPSGMASLLANAMGYAGFGGFADLGSPHPPAPEIGLTDPLAFTDYAAYYHPITRGLLGAASIYTAIKNFELSVTETQSTADILTSAAGRAVQNAGPGSGAVYGTRVHSEFESEVNSLGMANLRTEQSYLNGSVVPRGTPGSVRLDVVEGPATAPTTIYDLKTGTAELTTTRIQQIQRNIPGGSNVPVIQITPP